jgi:hypothetical protein
LAGLALALSALSPLVAASTDSGLGLVRQVPAINGGGTVEGSLHMMSPGGITFNGGAALTGDLFVPGTPTVRLNGKPNYGGTLDGNGPTTPTNYTITLNGQATLRNIIRRTAPLDLPAVPPPPAPAGSRNVVLGSASQPVGDWSTLRNLTLNGGAGQIAVPPGTYGDFTANGGSGFTLGISGSTTPATYHLQRLTLNGQARIDVVGPVVLTLANGLAANGTLGSADKPDWLDLRISSGGITLNGGCTIHAFVTAPAPGSGTVIINGNSTLVGGLVADKLIVNGGGLLRLRKGGGGDGDPVNTAPVAQNQSLSTAEDTALPVTLLASDADGDALTYLLESYPAHGTLADAAGAMIAPPTQPGTPVELASPALFYNPAPDFFTPADAPDTFTFRVRDARGLVSNLATVSIAITAVNDLPTALPIQVRTPEDTPVAITLIGIDPEGTELSFAHTTPLNGSLTGVAPALTYHPEGNYFGTDHFTYTVTDADGGVSLEALVEITVEPVNDVPVAEPQSLEMLEDHVLVITLAARDVENDPLTYALATLPTVGVLTLADGSEIPALGAPLPADAPPVLRFIPRPNYFGPAAFTFTASDGEATSEAASIQITVHPVNDAPVAALVQPDSTVRFVAPTLVPLRATVSDVDGADDVRRVVFLANNQQIGVAESAPWSVEWSVSQPGEFELQAVVYDQAGAEGRGRRSNLFPWWLRLRRF